MEPLRERGRAGSLSVLVVGMHEKIHSSSANYVHFVLLQRRDMWDNPSFTRERPRLLLLPSFRVSRFTFDIFGQTVPASSSFLTGAEGSISTGTVSNDFFSITIKFKHTAAFSDVKFISDNEYVLWYINTFCDIWIRSLIYEYGKKGLSDLKRSSWHEHKIATLSFRVSMFLCFNLCV
jgi:hypothetical protein